MCCMLTILIGISFLSCERNDTDTGQQASIPDELPLAIGQLNLPHKLVTRGTVDTKKSIGFCRTNDNGYAALNNIKGTYSTDKWIPAPAINLGQNIAKLAVYYPYNSSASGGIIPLSAACCDKDESMFLCCKQFEATNQSIYQDNKISLILEHVYARLVVTLARGTDYNVNAKPDWTTLKVQNDGMNISGTYNPLTNTYPSVSGDNYFEVTDMKDKVLGSTPTTDLRIIPFKLTGEKKLKITITVGGKAMSVETAIDGDEMKRGIQYNLTITVNPTALEITSIETVDWTSSTVAGEYETN